MKKKGKIEIMKLNKDTRKGYKSKTRVTGKMGWTPLFMGCDYFIHILSFPSLPPVCFLCPSLGLFFSSLLGYSNRGHNEKKKSSRY